MRIQGGRNQGPDISTMSYMDSAANKTRATSVGVTISQERHTDLEVHIPMTDVRPVSALLHT